jgi:hypothetical protein
MIVSYKDNGEWLVQHDALTDDTWRFSVHTGWEPSAVTAYNPTPISLALSYI